MTPNPQPDWHEPVARWWAEWLGDDASESPYFDDSCALLIEVASEESEGVITLTECEYLVSHRTCARAWRYLANLPGERRDIRHSNAKMKHLLDASKAFTDTAWANPAEALRDLAVAMGLNLTTNTNQQEESK